jgi:hypothetical protein
MARSGLAIDPSTGLIHGVIKSGANPIVTATDSAGHVGSVTFSWTVSNPCPHCLPQGQQ